MPFLTKWLGSKKKRLSTSTNEGYRKLVEHRLVHPLVTRLRASITQHKSGKVVAWEISLGASGQEAEKQG